MTKIVFLGDVHGCFDVLNRVITNENPDIIIQAGDFGIWPGLYSKVKTKNKNIPIYFCKGNHEDHDVLDTYEQFKVSNLKTGKRVLNTYLSDVRGLSEKEIRKKINIKFINSDNIFFCNTGSVLNIDDINILFIGGAESIDKDLRVIGRSWWPQELLRQSECDYILDYIEKNKIDIIVSHTCPKSILYKMVDIDNKKYKDPTCVFLDMVYQKTSPKFWFFGHFHKKNTFKYENTIFNALNMCNLDCTYDKSFIQILEF